MSKGIAFKLNSISNDNFTVGEVFEVRLGLTKDFLSGYKRLFSINPLFNLEKFLGQSF